MKTRGGHSFRPRVRQSSPPPVSGSNLGHPATTVVPPPTAATAVTTTGTAVVPAPTTTTAAAQGSTAVGSIMATAAPQASVAAAPTPRRYNTRVGPVLLCPLHPRPTRRALPFKRAQTSGLGESSSSRPRERQSPPTQGPAGDLPLDLSPTSIIR